MTLLLGSRSDNLVKRKLVLGVSPRLFTAIRERMLFPIKIPFWPKLGTIFAKVKAFCGLKSEAL